MTKSCVNDDILREILIRLPAESLIRSRAVCKSWRAIIDEPPFARAHQHHPINKSIVLFQTSPSSTCYSVDLEDLDFSSNGDQTIAATPLDYSNKEWSAVGACKGLVLTDRPLEIWNPLTNERLELDLDLDFEYDNELPAHFFGHTIADGLGYDYITEDYKAVLILSTCQTDVYSLKSDSWRTITNCPRSPKEGPGVFVGGALNWLPSHEKDDDNKIIALDLGTEKYTLLQMPPRWRDRFRYHDETVLDVLDGCLILCASGHNYRSPNVEYDFDVHLDVWVMKAYGDEGSWIELLSIEQMCMMHPYCLRPLGFIMRKEEEDKMRLQVFLDENDHCFSLFDVKTKTRKRVFIQHHFPYFFSQQMFPGTKFCLHDNCGRGGADENYADENSAEESFVFFIGG